MRRSTCASRSHNRHVAETLEDRGAIFVEDTAEVPEGALLVFSAHGVSPAVRAEACDRQRTIDATCPLVTKVHQEAKRFAREDFDILLVGHAGHEEVEGTSGEAPSHIQLVRPRRTSTRSSVRDPRRIVWLSQTTLSVDETMDTVRALRERFPTLQNPPSDDICYATQNRQVAVKAMAPHCDLVIVVGSRNSSNSVRLVEVALTAAVGAAHLVDYARDRRGVAVGVRTVGVTSASVPEVLVRECSTTSPSAAGRASRRSRPPRSRWSSRCPASCGRLALDDEPAQPQREHDAGGDGYRREAVHQRRGDDQQVRAVRAVAHQHDGRNGEREQQGRATTGLNALRRRTQVTARTQPQK